MYFLFSLRVSAVRLEPRSHYLFCRREGYMESPGNEVTSFMTLRSFCLNLLWSVLTRKLQGPGHENVKLDKPAGNGLVVFIPSK